MKKLNNKGFSLVELIVVIAIMAILVGVLAPSVLGQLEKANVAKDKQAIDAVATACAVAFADPGLTDKPDNGGDPVAAAGISWDMGGDGSSAEGVENPKTYTDLVQTMVGWTEVPLTSDQFSDATISASINTLTGKIEITCSFTNGEEDWTCTK